MKGAGLWQLRKCLKEPLVKGRRRARTPFLVNVMLAGRLGTYLLVPDLSLSDVWVLLLIKGLWLFLFFKKVLSTENRHFEIKSSWHVARILKVLSTRCEGGYSVWGLVNSCCAAVFVPGSVLWCPVCVFFLLVFADIMSIYSPVVGYWNVTT